MRRALALLCCLALTGAAGCATSGGVEVAGGADQVTPPAPPSPSPLPSGTPVSVDAVEVLRGDPQLDPKFKAALVPCEDGAYPVEDRYADLTGDGVAELLVTLGSCGYDTSLPIKMTGRYWPGFAGFVYDVADTPPTRLLAVQEVGVELVPAAGDGDDLAVVLTHYLERDDPCCPTDQTVVLYSWNGSALVEVPR